MLIVKVGLSRKLTRDFNSRGFSLDIQSELPSQTVDDPQALAQASGHLFQLASDLLDAELVKAQEIQEPANPIPMNGPAKAAPLAPDRNIGKPPPIDNGAPYRGGEHRPNAPVTGTNGAYHGGDQRQNAQANNGQGNERPITTAQTRAILNMARRMNREADQIAQDEYGIPLRSLTLKQASQVIDNLKSSIEGPVAQKAA